MRSLTEPHLRLIFARCHESFNLFLHKTRWLSWQCHSGMGKYVERIAATCSFSIFSYGLRAESFRRAKNKITKKDVSDFAANRSLIFRRALIMICIIHGKHCVHCSVPLRRCSFSPSGIYDVTFKQVFNVFK